MLSFREFLYENNVDINTYKISPLEEEILNSFDMIVEGSFWGCYQKVRR